MTAREFLDQYRRAERIADRLQAEYEKELLQIDAVKSVSDMDGMPHGTGINKTTEDKAIRLADKAMAWKTAKLEAIEIRQEVFETICDIPDIEGDVLYERYIHLRKWEEICVRLNYSWHGIHSVHRRALSIVDGLINRA